MTDRSSTSSIVRRWLVFNSVGAMGIVVQMATLLLLASVAGLNYLIATGLAVETAVVHNFVWHEHWTWADRTQSGHHGLLRRLVLFHAANGSISIVGNLFLIKIFVEVFGIDYLCANGLSIATCTIFNFLSGDRVVFRTAHTERKE